MQTRLCQAQKQVVPSHICQPQAHRFYIGEQGAIYPIAAIRAIAMALILQHYSLHWGAQNPCPGAGQSRIWDFSCSHSACSVPAVVAWGWSSMLAPRPAFHAASLPKNPKHTLRLGGKSAGHGDKCSVLLAQRTRFPLIP